MILIIKSYKVTANEIGVGFVTDALFRFSGHEGNLSHIVNADIHEVSSLTSKYRFIASRIESGHETASFLVTNLSTIIQQWYQWKELLPMVEPFYGKNWRNNG